MAVAKIAYEGLTLMRLCLNIFDAFLGNSRPTFGRPCITVTDSLQLMA